MGDLTKNFSRYEFQCKCGCGYDQIKPSIVYALQIIRDHFDASVPISSGCRCGKHNTNEGGHVNSKHLFGLAADFTVSGVTPKDVADFIEGYFGGNNGLGRYTNFTHFNTTGNRRARWGHN